MKEVKAEVDQAPEIPFEEVESMVDEALALPEVESMVDEVEVESLVNEALALPPPREFHIQVRTF